MFDIGATELLLIVIVAILVIGPKDMPAALRMVGRWVGKMRKLSAQFRSGFDSMVREAELEDMEKKWKAQNEKIMREHPEGAPAEMEPTGAYPATMTPHKADELKIIAAKQEAAAEQAKDLAAAADRATTPTPGDPASATGDADPASDSRAAAETSPVSNIAKKA
ncbi:MAG: twin-arginine translocase subunit TatB [Erythrobacter sp.]|nr:MAG: twin-arginine translocase subunit TatB [Erythrobacter sp.]